MQAFRVESLRSEENDDTVEVESRGMRKKTLRGEEILLYEATALKILAKG